jgi:ParB-like chromosome segregation protein Spo0J
MATRAEHWRVLADRLSEGAVVCKDLVDDAGTIIAGHGRVLAAQTLGITEVPVMIAAGWSEAQKRAYVIADNKLALNAGWDAELLPVELGDLKNLGFDD